MQVVRWLPAIAASVLALFGCSQKDPNDPDGLQGHGTSFDKLVYITEASRSDDPGAPAKIARFLTDPDPEIVGKSAYYLGSLHARSYIPALTTLLTNKDKHVVNLAGAGLREMIDGRDTALLPKLYPLLDHEDKLARMSAIECIARVGNPDSTELLLARLAREDFAAQRSLVKALGAIKDPKALPALEARLLEVKAMAPEPYRGGSRGDPPTPAEMQLELEEAIENIRSDAIADADAGDASWLHSRAGSQHSNAEWTALSPVRVEGVWWNIEEAVGSLDQAAFRKLTQQDVDRMSLDPPTRAGRSAYLIRAVSNARTHRDFTVLSNGSAIVVQHNSFARRTNFQKDVVVVFLDRPPTEVFVEATVAAKPDISRAGP
jgi:hypothetical protein